MLPIIVFPPKLIRKIHQKWKDSLIVKLLGKSIGYKALNDRGKALQRLSNKVSMIDIWEWFFLISFANIEDYNYVFTGGPWIIMNHYLTVNRWEPNFKPSEAKEISTAIWLRQP